MRQRFTARRHLLAACWLLPLAWASDDAGGRANSTNSPLQAAATADGAASSGSLAPPPAVARPSLRGGAKPTPTSAEEAEDVPGAGASAAGGAALIPNGTEAAEDVPGAAAADGPCNVTSTCLTIVDNFLARQRTFSLLPPSRSLLQTFGPAAGGGPCGALCELTPHCVGEQCRFDVYDNAVAAIYWSRRGDLSQARVILDAFRELLYPPAPPGQQRQLQLLNPAYSNTGAVLEWKLDTGNNAWVGMAFAHFAAASGEACYTAVARDILHTLARETRCDDVLGGFMGVSPRPMGTYRSTEHNIDMFALARMLGETALQAQAGRFVAQMFAFDPNHPQTYATGTSATGPCAVTRNALTPVAADTQFWNLLADADPSPSRKAASLAYTLRPAADGGLLSRDRDAIGDGQELLGLRFSTLGHGAQWENTASAVIGLGYYVAVYKQAPDFVQDALLGMRTGVLHQLEEYHGVLASVLGGNYQAWMSRGRDDAYPGGSDTGLGWTYLRYPHTAATAWAGLMLLEVDPFLPPPGGVPGAPELRGQQDCFAGR